jgi:hypothetical protein
MIYVPPDVMADLEAGRAKGRFWWRVDTSPVTAIWTGKTELTYGGQLYLPCPVANPPKFAAQGSDLGVRTTSVELPAPSNLVDDFFDTLDLGLDVVRSGVWIIDDAGTVRLNRQLHRGRVDNLEAGDATKDISILKLTSTTRGADAKRTGGRIACDSDQRRRDANDGFFKHTAGAQDIEIIVGGLGPVSTSGSTTVTGGGRDFSNFDTQYR